MENLFKNLIKVFLYLTPMGWIYAAFKLQFYFNPLYVMYRIVKFMNIVEKDIEKRSL